MKRTKRPEKATVVEIRPADDVWGVTTLHHAPGEGSSHQRTPCRECPWRKDSPVGKFPAEAYRLSACTAYDASFHTFACHMGGSEHPVTCAGFLISNSENNLSVRIAMARDQLDRSKLSSKAELYASYRDMAVANGVCEDDPALARCRADWE